MGARSSIALRNDTESQGLFLVAAGAWVVLGAGGLAAVGAFGAYAVARSFHTLFLLRPLQPARTRAFAAGHVVMLGVLADGLRLAVVGWKY